MEHFCLRRRLLTFPASLYLWPVRIVRLLCLFPVSLIVCLPHPRRLLLFHTLELHFCASPPSPPARLLCLSSLPCPSVTFHPSLSDVVSLVSLCCVYLMFDLSRREGSFLSAACERAVHICVFSILSLAPSRGKCPDHSFCCCCVYFVLESSRLERHCREIFKGKVFWVFLERIHFQIFNFHSGLQWNSFA